MINSITIILLAGIVLPLVVAGAAGFAFLVVASLASTGYAIAAAGLAGGLAAAGRVVLIAEVALG